REQHVEYLGGHHVLRWVEEQRVDARLARFQVLLQLGACGTDVIGPLKSVHPLVQRPLGGRCRGLDWGGHVGGEYSRGSRARKGIRPVFRQIHLDLESRLRLGGLCRSLGKLCGNHRGCSALFGAWTSWRLRTAGSPCFWAAIARTASEAPVIVVTQGMPWRTAAVRIAWPSARAPEPVGVLITRSQRRSRIRSTTWGEPSPTLFIRVTGTPIEVIDCAVPP